MILTIADLKIKYHHFSDIQGKIHREIKDGKYIQLIRGLYETNKETPGYYLASYIYGPSYLSFDYALYYYGLIPEKVTTYTSATFNKRKTKSYHNDFGHYVYQDVPKKAYPYELKTIEEYGYVYHIATKEKALCDKLYTVKPVHSMKQFIHLLFEDLRIDQDVFNTLDKEKIKMLCHKYHSTNLKFLYKLVKEKTYANH